MIWETAVEKETVLRALASTLGRDAGLGSAESVFEAILKREAQGSTFFNEGVAFPHVRVEGLADPVIALGLTREGIIDVATDKPIEIVFLILSPARSPRRRSGSWAWPAGRPRTRPSCRPCGPSGRRKRP
ncbi:MAG: PTS sugar transporter subunit IIA [Comamonadaceae bacterium]|nr:PTS sugar transporter subunit IIA [Comamonadaceae bacterium]